MMPGLPSHLKTHPHDELVNYILRQVEYVDETAVVGLQDDIGTIDVLSKVLQVGII